MCERFGGRVRARNIQVILWCARILSVQVTLALHNKRDSISVGSTVASFNIFFVIFKIGNNKCLLSWIYEFFVYRQCPLETSSFIEWRHYTKLVCNTVLEKSIANFNVETEFRSKWSAYILLFTYVFSYYLIQISCLIVRFIWSKYLIVDVQYGHLLSLIHI